MLNKKADEIVAEIVSREVPARVNAQVIDARQYRESHQKR